MKAINIEFNHDNGFGGKCTMYGKFMLHVYYFDGWRYSIENQNGIMIDMPKCGLEMPLANSEQEAYDLVIAEAMELPSEEVWA